jgi:hypothetical protein
MEQQPFGCRHPLAVCTITAFVMILSLSQRLATYTVNTHSSQMLTFQATHRQLSTGDRSRHVNLELSPCHILRSGGVHR